MKWFLPALLLLVACQSKPSETQSELDIQSEPDSVIQDNEFELPPKTDWNYEILYGHYEHESNTRGFNSFVEIRPEGNDVWFDLSVNNQSCTGQASGFIGIALRTDNEYAGFYENNDCRLEFYFNIIEKTIRIEEVGFCKLHETGCGFAGVYRQVKKTN
ncbi:MAG: hypothetical protein MUC73_00385 [Cyclobacteriaceae bacterium]|jgi:hypothetical protein|nr:hypothetical protein [Cyclobacteriaceae bacterium]